MQRKHQIAFTLVELLVVVAIIGILTAFLLMAISLVKVRAQRLKCVNNVRQQGIGMLEFITDYHHYPLGVNQNFYRGAYHEDGVIWEHALLEEMGMNVFDTNNRPAFYKNNEGVFRCPAAVDWIVQIPGGQMSNPDYGYNADGLTQFGPDGATALNSLGLGGHGVSFNRQSASWYHSPILSSEVVNPGATLAIGDGFSGGKQLILDVSPYLSRNRDWNGSRNQLYLNYKQNTEWVYSRHRGRSNIAFCDGHVESPTLQYLFDDISDEALSCWNRDHQPHREQLRQ